MTITLTATQQAWIDEHVAQGDYASAEDATRILLDEAMYSHDGGADDLSWAKALVDEALADVERGETISAAESRADIAAVRETLKK